MAIVRPEKKATLKKTRPHLAEKEKVLAEPKPPLGRKRKRQGRENATVA